MDQQYVFVVTSLPEGMILAADGPGTQEQAIAAAVRYGRVVLGGGLDDSEVDALFDEGWLDRGNHILSVVSLTPFPADTDKPGSGIVEVKCPENLRAARDFADGLGKSARRQLDGQINRLANWGSGNGVTLYFDSAPYSFGFGVFKIEGANRRVILSGGLIYDPNTKRWGAHT